MKNTSTMTLTPVLPTDKLVGAKPSPASRCLNLCPDQSGQQLRPVDTAPAIPAPQLPLPPYSGTLIPRPIPDFNSIAIHASKADTVTTDITGLTVMTDPGYDSNRIRHITNLPDIALCLHEAYNRIAAQADELGTNLQPRLMAWQLVDSNGNIITRSVPTLVCNPDATFALAGTLSIPLTKTSYTIVEQQSTATLSADTYTVSIHVPAMDISDDIARKANRLEILATPPLHPITQTLPYVRLSYHDSANATATACMPGIGTSDTRLNSLIEKSLHRFRQLASVVHTITNPVIPGKEQIFDIPLSDTALPLDTIDAVNRVLAKDITPAPPDITVQCSAPNSFTAGNILAAGDTMLMADITPQRFSGYAPDIYAVTDGPEGPFRQLSKTLFSRTGEVIVAHCQSDSGSAPGLISSLIVSPHPDATSITLRVAAADGVVRSRTFPLTASPCGLYSYYLARQLKPQMLTDIDDAYVIPAPITATRRYPNAILSAPVDAPLSITGQCTVGSGSIRRITPCVGSSSAWNFARQHHAVWATDGIYSLSVNSSRTILSATRLHPVGITRPDAVAPTPWAIYAALSDGSVYSLSGSRIRPITYAATATALGYEPHRHELWLKSTESTENIIIPLPDAEAHYSRSQPAVQSFVSDGHRLLAIDPDGQPYDLSGSIDPPRPITVEYSSRWDSSYDRGHRIGFTKWDIQSTHASLTASLRMDSGTGPANSYPLLRLVTNGPVNAPVNTRTAVRPLRWINLTVNGRTHPDTTIGPFHLIFY